MEIPIANSYFVNFSALRANFIATIKSVRPVHKFLPYAVIRIEKSTLRHGMLMCIVNFFVASHLLFGSVKHFLYQEFLYFNQNIALFWSLCLPFFGSLQSPFALFRWTQKSVPTLPIGQNHN